MEAEDLQYSFVDMDGCTVEERHLLESILWPAGVLAAQKPPSHTGHDDKQQQQQQQQLANSAAHPNPDANAHVSAIPGAPNVSLLPPAFGHSLRHPVVAPFAPPTGGSATNHPAHPHLMQQQTALYPNPSIYINNVTANVNLLPHPGQPHMPPNGPPPSLQPHLPQQQTHGPPPPQPPPLMQGGNPHHPMLIASSSAPPGSDFNNRVPNLPHPPPHVNPHSLLSNPQVANHHHSSGPPPPPPAHSMPSANAAGYVPPFSVASAVSAASLYHPQQFYPPAYMGIPTTFGFPQTSGQPSSVASVQIPPPPPSQAEHLEPQVGHRQQQLQQHDRKKPQVQPRTETLPSPQGREHAQNNSLTMQENQNMALRRSMQLLPEPSAINGPPSIQGPMMPMTDLHAHPPDLPVQKNEDDEQDASGQTLLEAEKGVDSDNGDASKCLQVQGGEEVQEENVVPAEESASDPVVEKEEVDEEPSGLIPEEATAPDHPQQPPVDAWTAPAPAADSKPKSWASLFHSNAPVIVGMPVQSSEQDSGPHKNGGKPTAKVTPFNQTGGESKDNAESAGILSHTLTPDEMALVDYLKTYSLNHRTTSIRPRGLKNRSNWCFVNAILQALIACPPFFNFMHFLPLFSFEAGPAVGSSSGEAAASDGEKRWPILRAVWHFLRDVEVQTHFPNKNRGKNKKQDDISLGRTVEATTILNSLLELRSDNFKVEEGRQEDAEEFLTFLLNGLNDEALDIVKLLDESEDDSAAKDGPVNPLEDPVSADDDNDDWKEVGPKRRSCITRRTATSETPVAAIFQGQIRSCVNYAAGQPTATLQPFFTLQLDIQSEAVRSVADALKVNFDTESLDGYVCAKTKREVDATRSMSLEELPPILVLHLKRFVFDQGEAGLTASTGGCKKLLKPIDFPVDLEIKKEILSPSAAAKYRGHRERQYKLFAVVYHNGTEATKGHYVADVYHGGLSTWLHCDDGHVKSITEQNVLSHSPSGNSLPYILFYRRGDTMGQADRAGKGTGAASNAGGRATNLPPTV